MRHAIGVDIGGSNIRAAVVSEQGDIVDRRSISTPKSVDAVLGQTRALIESLGHHAAHGIGIGIPGRVRAGA